MSAYTSIENAPSFSNKYGIKLTTLTAESDLAYTHLVF